MIELYDMLDQVKDRDTFLAFVAALHHDVKDERESEGLHPASPWSSGANGWQHGPSVEGFLDAALAWATDAEGKLGLAEEPSWKDFARFLYMGKIYE